jgi:hypothetical protein
MTTGGDHVSSLEPISDTSKHHNGVQSLGRIASLGGCELCAQVHLRVILG